ncbi:MAG: hypothetical protein P8Z79_06080, partial [Sedimentisphaerales bacterium]
MRILNQARISFVRVMTMWAALVLFATTVFAQERREVPALVGCAVGPQMDEIVPKRFIVDPPTIE